MFNLSVRDCLADTVSLLQPKKKAPFPNKTFAEFFAGIGLMRLGLEKEGWIAAFANDISTDKHEMYAHHFKDKHPLYLVQDVHSLTPENIPSVTLATASFPCNDLSLAGMRHGLGGKQSSAYWGFIKLLDKMGKRRPPACTVGKCCRLFNLARRT